MQAVNAVESHRMHLVVADNLAQPRHEASEWPLVSISLSAEPEERSGRTIVVPLNVLCGQQRDFVCPAHDKLRTRVEALRRGSQKAALCPLVDHVSRVRQPLDLLSSRKIKTGEGENEVAVL